ncbi:nuclear transport factor 2 family protein [Mycobacterium sp.]|uniref:nuclear transport factor 2 family protein n=1 Tax=Mycobacterium sp. TaxID=1785 RepID=UPI00334155EE
MTDAPQTNIDLVRTLIRAVDNADHNAIAARTTANVHFRFGNAAPTSSQSELLAAAESFRAAIADLRHTVLEIWEVDDTTVIAIMDVYYRRLDGRELNLPCCNVFRVRNGLVDTYLIYMDVNPVIDAQRGRSESHIGRR